MKNYIFKIAALLGVIFLLTLVYQYKFNPSLSVNTPIAKSHTKHITPLTYIGQNLLNEFNQTTIDNYPTAAGTYDLATMASQITSQLTQAFSNAAGKPLPLVANWNVGIPEYSNGLDPMYMINRLANGEHIVPTWKLDAYFNDTIGLSYYEESIKKAAELGLPLVFILPSPESALTQDDVYFSMDKTNNPNVITTNGTVLPKLSPFGPNNLWNEVGEQWSTTSLMAQLQEWYPNPPLVLFIDTDSSKKLSWSELATSSRYTSQYPADATDEFKRTLVNAKWIEKYRQLHQGFKNGFISESWKKNAKFISRNQFALNMGTTSDWHKSATTTNLYANIWPLTADGLTIDFNLEGDRTDTTNAPHTLLNNLPFMLDQAKVLDSNFTYQLSINANKKIDNPQRYRGFTQFALWFLRPSIIRQTPNKNMKDEINPLFQQVVDSVELVNGSDILADFWKNGKLVKAGDSNYNLNIPTEYQNVPREFLLKTDASSTVWAFALEKGVAPNREWLIYVQSPEGNLTNITVDAPDIGNISVNSSQQGTFYSFSNNNNTLSRAINTDSIIPSFPNAEGAGAISQGGRNGLIYEVTNLNDTGVGSLRYGLELKEPRIILFKISGIINISEPLLIENPYLSILGQSAPKGGITIKGNEISIHTHDVIIQYIKVRTGRNDNFTEQVGDAIGMSDNAYNNIIDHCSLSWSNDENCQAWSYLHPSHNLTWSWNIISEGLTYEHASCGLITGSNINPDEMTNLDIHHNLFAHFNNRMPLLKIKSSRMINNLIYDWVWWPTGLSGGVGVDIINNKFLPGPNTLKSRYFMVVVRTQERLKLDGFEDNKMYGPSGEPSIFIQNNVFNTESGNDWQYVRDWDDNLWKTIDEKLYRRFSPLPKNIFPITIHPINTEETNILRESGASLRITEKGELINARDSIDTRIINEYQAKTGIIPKDESDVGGYEVIQSKDGYIDSDHDGISDIWEEYYHLNPYDKTDAYLDPDNNGFNNFEEFIYGLKPIQ